MEQRLCVRCDAPVPATRRKSAKYCSSACQVQLEHNPAREKACEHCSKLFVTTFTHKRFCSERCSLDSRTAHSLSSERSCSYCGKPFLTAILDKEFCSQQCSRAATKERKGRALRRTWHPAR